MESPSTEIAHKFAMFRVYKDGRIEKFIPTHKIPPSTDPTTGVQSKDVIISTEPNISARLFLPKIHDPTRKLPVLFYVHGGGFCIESAFSPGYHNHLVTLAAEANVIAVSIEYGLFPDHPIPACYEDSWAGLKWMAAHAEGNGPDPWLNDHADFSKVYIAGDSAGANIGHTMAVRVGSMGLPGVKVVGLVLVHAYFGGDEKDDAMWLYMCPTNKGSEDPRIKPPAEDLAILGCEKVLMFMAEKDKFVRVGEWYCDELKKSGWKGSLEIIKHLGENHVFHLFNSDCENALHLVQKFASFINQA
ncbi:Alpha/beta hydrolase-3 [Corchorus olitorius]|uniref:Alpha/beta hydrolase-3 n=1 Tax=Corchorus olitorius TaxID=93759 RepID=A0A1R3GYW3_9ROSI|nr:Alpha/beta hydrolase-3 [Corchorus olitorius]